MNIAINALSAKIGGGVTYIRHIVPHLLAADKDNTYYVFIREGMEAILPAEEGTGGKLKIIKIRAGNLFTRLFKEQFVVPWLISRYRIDLLYCPANILVFFAPCRKILQVQTIDPFFKFDGDSLMFRIRNIVLRLVSKFSVSCADIVVFSSSYSKELVQGKMPGKNIKARIIHLAVDLAGFDPTAALKGKYILSVSNITKRKNFDVLIRAYAKLKADLSKEYNLVIVGEIAGRDCRRYYQGLLTLVKRLGLESRVRFTGRIEQAAIAGYYRSAALFVLPSLAENFSFTPLEAMAAGVPVIVSNGTGNPETIGPEGLLFDPQDPDELCRQMEQLLLNETLRQELARRGRARAAEFSWPGTASLLLNVFREAGKK
jgi:hypothetical protein